MLGGVELVHQTLHAASILEHFTTLLSAIMARFVGLGARCSW